MDQNEFVEKIREQFDGADGANFTFETQFRDVVGWGSIVGLGIIMMIEETYDVRMSADDLRAQKTIEDIYNFVVSKGSI